MLKLCLVGGLGRMGKTIAGAVQQTEDAMISSVWEHPEIAAEKPNYKLETGYSKNEVVVTAQGVDAASLADVIVDFSTSEIFDQIVEVAANLEKPLVTGTTGIEAKAQKLEALASKVAVVDAPNMALGVNLLFAITEMIGRSLPAACDIEIVEAHHRTKRDAPSGTALRIANILSDIMGRDVSMEPHRLSRSDGIRIHSLRMGAVPGIHSVYFALEGEVLEIKHTALSRSCFAAGAVRAAFFVSEAPPGIYDMKAVLGIKRRRD